MMTAREPSPNFNSDPDDTFRAMTRDIQPSDSGYAEQFTSLDARLRAAMHASKSEAEVICHLAPQIPTVTSLKQILDHLRKFGIEYPTCNDVTDMLHEMVESGEYAQQTEDFMLTIIHMEKLAMLVEQLARSETRLVDLSKDDILDEIVAEETFNYIDREALINATETFLPTE